MSFFCKFTRIQIEKITTMVTSFWVDFCIVFPCKFKCFFSLSLKFKSQRERENLPPPLAVPVKSMILSLSGKNTILKRKGVSLQNEEAKEERTKKFFFFFKKGKVKTKKNVNLAGGRKKIPFSFVLPHPDLKCIALMCKLLLLTLVA